MTKKEKDYIKIRGKVKPIIEFWQGVKFGFSFAIGFGFGTLIFGLVFFIILTILGVSIASLLF